jgi:spermidine/putrescine transport system ATP-binding protein
LEPFLLIKNLRKSFEEKVIVNIDHLNIHKGEIITILGPSGCGKTTLLRLLAGFEQPDQGKITLEGQDLAPLAPNQRRINTVFQNYALFPHLTVFENIAFGLQMVKTPKDELETQVFNMLKLIQMTDLADHYPTQISGGQKQRVAIARALVLKPEILLLDEPLAALDLKLRQRMLLELELIHDEVGITFIFITHDQTEAMSISDRIAIMNQGSIEQLGTPKEIYEAPCSNFVASFIGDSNFFEGLVCSDISEEYIKLDVECFGQLICQRNRPVGLQEAIIVGVRPEKIHISKLKPTSSQVCNLLQAKVEDIIYLGPQTKYWVKIGNKRVIVLHQHHHFLSREEMITWNDQVWISWEASDSFILEKSKSPQQSISAAGLADQLPSRTLLS